MATSSITKNFVISGKEQVEMFANAIERAANDNKLVGTINANYLTDPVEIEKFMKKRKKVNYNKFFPSFHVLKIRMLNDSLKNRQ